MAFVGVCQNRSFSASRFEPFRGLRWTYLKDLVDCRCHNQATCRNASAHTQQRALWQGGRACLWPFADTEPHAHMRDCDARKHEFDAMIIVNQCVSSVVPGSDSDLNHLLGLDTTMASSLQPMDGPAVLEALRVKAVRPETLISMDDEELQRRYRKLALKGAPG